MRAKRNQGVAIEFAQNEIKGIIRTTGWVLGTAGGGWWWNWGKMEYYAHSLEGRPLKEWQKLEDHLRQTAEMAREFAAGFESGDWAAAAGFLHDIGKAAPEFQAYLAHENGLDDVGYDGAGGGRVNHSSAGAAFAEDVMKAIPGRTLAYLAAGHHAGLPDWFSDPTGNAALSVRLAEGRENLKRIRAAVEVWSSGCRPPAKAPPFVCPNNYHFWVRMLYSCLVDADFLDTETFMRAVRNPGFASLDELRKRLDRHMAAKMANCEGTPVNLARRDVLAACRKAANETPGLYSLTVPTGGGKTLSGMAFALDHAIRHGKRRVIYVIPYTSIIEQTAAVLRNIFGDDNVVEHHSNLDPEKETERSRLASENWDAPIVVTTNVQCFESLYSAKPSRCRKLHNIVSSVVILDEAQLIPPQWLIPSVDAIRELTVNYSVTVLLSTATQPALPGLDPKEIISDPAGLYERLRRTDISMPPDLNTVVEWGEVARRLKQHEQVLCIVNTRRDCRELFDLMPDGTIHLSALMCSQHRSEKIDEIKQLLKNGNPVRVVSTQLVEAGVDIDFPVVYRALGGLDSIAQAAGRCNREGRLPGKGQIHVFVPPRDPPRGLLRKAAATTREMGALPNYDPQAPETFRKYFELFYPRVNDNGGDFLKSLQKDVPNVPFRTAGDTFTFIDDTAQRPVIVRYRGSEPWIDRLRFVGPTREIMRRLQRYTVNVPSRMVDDMIADGRLAFVDEKKAPGVVAQACMRYNDVFGLDVYAAQLPAEDLIV